MTGQRPVTVLVVDDHPVFREGFAALLGSIDEVEVVGTAATGAEAVEQAARHEPDVVVMDVSMPGMDGIEATRHILRERPETGVVVLTMSEEDGTIFEALRAGARGYLLKGAEPEEVVRAITTVAGGGVVFGAVLAGRITDFLAPRPQSGAATAFPGLTAREHEVLDLVAAGLSNGEIAARLFLSQKTVRNHVHAVLGKIQAADRAEAIIRGRDAGLGR
ncbi:response regulator [Microbispora triticiradicis]|uniref:Response regulator transcription factor n=2 Tax=Microbispora TaxID=2005 RepID=A0ABY3M0P2_9ACTN|nr:MULTISPECIES: response regulator transcription factor [Microbispora]TLP62453.1 response regulator transcription factor [Microbispora fusca]TYB62484.1 response regulator transcription factor [Microbispora tritici]